MVFAVYLEDAFSDRASFLNKQTTRYNRPVDKVENFQPSKKGWKFFDQKFQNFIFEWFAQNFEKKVEKFSPQNRNSPTLRKNLGSRAAHSNKVTLKLVWKVNKEGPTLLDFRRRSAIVIASLEIVVH